MLSLSQEHVIPFHALLTCANLVTSCYLAILNLPWNPQGSNPYAAKKNMWQTCEKPTFLGSIMVHHGPIHNGPSGPLPALMEHMEPGGFRHGVKSWSHQYQVHPKVEILEKLQLIHSLDWFKGKSEPETHGKFLPSNWSGFPAQIFPSSNSMIHGKFD